jgi:TnpA family transposase
MLDRAAARIRAEVNGSIFDRVHERMGSGGRARMAELLERRRSDGTTEHNHLKKPARSPTWSHFREQKEQLAWVDDLGPTAEWLADVAAAKVGDFAGEAEAADAPGMRDYEPVKRAVLLACLVRKAQMRARDDLAEMFTKRVALQVKRAKAELAALHEQQQAMVEALIGNYRTLLQHVDADGPVQQAKEKAAGLATDVLDALADVEADAGAGEVASQLGGAVASALHALAAALKTQSGGLAAVLGAVEGFGGFAGQYEQSEKVSAHHGNYWEVLLYGHLRKDRAVMYDFTQLIELRTTSDDTRVLTALAHALRHKLACDFIPDTDQGGRAVDISFATLNWQKAIRDKNRPGRFVRRHFEAMVTALAESLRTGDIAVAGSETHADWSEQLLDMDEVEAKLPEYLVEVGLVEPGDPAPYDAAAFGRQLQDKLVAAAAAADAGYPDNDGLAIDPDTGIPSLKAHRSEKQTASAKRLEEAIKARMPERTLLGITARTAYWVEWWRRFGPASGAEPKLKDPFGRYVLTTFTKGTNMGPYEAAKHIPGVTGHELSLAANRHFSIALLNEAIADVVNAHAQLDISQAWGDGSTVAADGTHMDTYLNNLLAETSIRYGKPGGIAYHHISDTYIALFTHFIPCGVWEAVYIIEGLLKNASELKPKTVHADTQGQSFPVFALAHLLGFDLVPRIRNWKDLTFYRPAKSAEYVHIDALFGESGKNVIDFDLIESQFRHLMRVAISVREGALSSTLLLRRLRSGSNKNATYTAFREVGRVIRTIALLRFLSDAPLRRRVTAATNKVEAFNGFSQWVGFGNDGVIADNDPAEQEKTAKFNALLTNAIIFQNALDIAEVVRHLQNEGMDIDPEDLAQVSPYLTGHIRRFGEYSTHELADEPDAYDPHLDVDFTPLRGENAGTDGFGRAA